MIDLHTYKIAIVIPYYNAEQHIANVIRKIPDYITKVYVVNDDSPQKLPMSQIEKLPNFSSVQIINSDKNRGVGGATKIGMLKAIEDKMDFIIKLDSDDQMDVAHIPALLEALINDESDYAKGNRFRDFKALKSMPKFRKFGNLMLSFLTKMATGYWNNFDPTNGFFAVKREYIEKVDFDNLSERYFFETSLISEMYFLDSRIKDVPMPALYGDEKSSMSVWKMPFVFLPRLIKTFFKRLFKTYFIHDFNISSIYLLIGAPLFLFGVIFGIYKWWYYSSVDELAPTGTIMLVTLSIILGFQLLLQATHYDIMRAPKARK